MRGIEALLLAAFVGLIAMGVWNGRRWVPGFGTKAVISTPIEAGKSNVEKPKSKEVRAKRVLLRRNDGDNTITVGIPISKTEVDVPPAEFPSPGDFPVGASGAKIRARYGEPTVRVTETNGGHVLERYYYFNNDRTQLVTATLEKGVVVSAETTSP